MSGLFTASVIAAAQAAQKKWGPPACVALGQYFIESACGKLEPPGSHNGLGIQALPGLPLVEAVSHEYISGNYVQVTERFAKFKDDNEEFDCWGRLIATGKVKAYKLAMAHCDNWRDFVHYMSKAYSTTPAYEQALESVITKYDLAQYNVTTKTNGGVTPAAHGGDAPGLQIGGVLWVQRHLMFLGYDVGPTGADGVMGSNTKGALKKFASDHQLADIDGVLTVAEMQAIDEALEKAVAEKA
jgi:hypothetical protein